MESRATIDHVQRIERVAAALSVHDAFVVDDLVDVRWLTGFTGSNGWVVVRTGDGAPRFTLGTDLRYRDRAESETAATGIEIVAEARSADLLGRLIDVLGGVGSVGIDARTTSHAAWGSLAERLPIRPWESVVKTAREVKDEAEIARIERAASAADAALAEIEPMILDAASHPLTEADVRTELEYRMRLHGADDRAYPTIVASGPEHGARPHHEVSNRTIVDGDTVIVDVGATVDGYRSDMTRSWVVGEPTLEQREVYEVVRTAQEAGLESLADGVDCADLDAACRGVVERSGHRDWWRHGVSHGVGLDIHETPFATSDSGDAFRSGNVVTVEPGLYRGGFGGFRIEDLVLVTDTGHRVLTHSPKRELT